MLPEQGQVGQGVPPGLEGQLGWEVPPGWEALPECFRSIAKWPGLVQVLVGLVPWA